MVSRIASTISNRFSWMQILMLTTAGLAASAYCVHQAGDEVTPSQYARTFLRKKDYITEDLARFQFELPNNIQSYMSVTPFPVYFTFVNEELSVTRDYTPIVWDFEKKTMEFIIQRIPGGNTSTYLHQLSLGSPLRMKGPFSQWTIPANYEKIGMIAGDSGITVFVQILPDLLQKGKKIHLLFYSTSNLHLLKQDLEQIKKLYPDQFSITYLEGEPSKDHVEMYLPSPTENPLVMLCCPKPLMGAMAGYKDESSLLAQGEFSGFLKELNFKAANVHKF